MRLLTTLLFLGISLMGTAQRACSSHEYMESRMAADPAAAQGVDAAARFIARQSGSARLRALESTVIHIPVVVHVLYANAAQNLSDEQINSQILALNRDFRHLNSDSVNTPDRFRGLAADIAIEFYLASVTPEGYPTNGIVRKATGVSQWRQDDAMKFASAGGDNAWDSHSYLNIWVCPLGRLLGYASTPGSAADRDGIVINSSAFGTIGASAPFDKGRTAVHEAGHWLGLKHIWGDTYCGNDDVDDTPKQNTYSSGCPSGIRASCDNGAAGSMYMNYMDYTNDACINLFTNGQKDRMRANFVTDGPRFSLLQSRGLGKPWAMPPAVPVVKEIAPNVQSLTLYPNPAHSGLSIDFADARFTGKELRLYNMQGALLQQNIISSRQQKLNVSGLAAGVYWIVTSNGEDVLRVSFVKQ
jgi:hypothetical protein